MRQDLIFDSKKDRIMNNKPIGIFDSGIGGLSLIKKIKKVLPKESITYLADNLNFPYGNKTPHQLRIISEKNVKWLLSQKAKLIVIACNTATVNSINYLRSIFPESSFVGLEPAIKPAAKLCKKGIIILSSPKSTTSKQLNLLIKKFAKNKKVFNLGSLKLVRAVEQSCSTAKTSKILKDILLKQTLNRADIIVLGCTHFPLIHDQIQKFVGENIKIIDSGEAVAKRIKTLLKEKKLLSKEEKPKYKFFTSGKKKNIRGITFNSTHL